MDMPLFNDILIIFGLGIVVIFVCLLARIPVIVGLLLTGAMAGPHGLGLISQVHEVERLAEIGVVSLLFTIGMGLSFENILQMGKAALLGGSTQVLLTCLLGFAAAKAAGIGTGESIFVGFLLAHSSTTILLKVFQERAELHSPHCRTSLAVSLFQDIGSVPMMLAIPLLLGSQNQVGGSTLMIFIKGIAVVLASIFAAKYVIPQLLYQIARTRSRELFMLSLIVICFGIAWITSSIGLSLALGAFLAGLIISDSPYTQQALGDIMPFRDVFTSFFFVSVGMLLNFGFIFKYPILIIGITIAVLISKAMIGGFATFLLGYPRRTILLTGFALCSVGEFSFVLSQAGQESGLLHENVYQTFLAVSVLTMAATPFIINAAPKLAAAIAGIPLPIKHRPAAPTAPQSLQETLQDHLIIIGYGVNGKNLSRAARSAGIPYVILEMNPVTVRTESKKGEPIYYGDATQRAVLEYIGIKTARVMVVAISDPIATRSITAVANRINSGLYIIARTRFLQEMQPLYKLGADEVVPEDFETSVEIFTRVLRKYLIPRDQVEKFVGEVRSDNYEMFRSLSRTGPTISDLKLTLPNVEISSLRVAQGAPIAGKSLRQIDLRRKYSVTLLAIRRNSEILTNPDADAELKENDQLILLGRPEKLAALLDLIESPDTTNENNPGHFFG
jgi:CPA2 family monovalent cation:H+ antiporter-2